MASHGTGPRIGPDVGCHRANSRLLSAGPTVTPIIKAAITAMAYAMTIGVKNAPGRPSSTATGRIAKTATMAALINGRWTVASACWTDTHVGSASGPARRARSRCTNVSPGAIASATTIATAAAG